MLMWDTTILESNRPDITLLHKSSHETILINIAIPWQNLVKAEEEKYRGPNTWQVTLEKCTKRKLMLFPFVGIFLLRTRNLKYLTSLGVRKW